MLAADALAPLAELPVTTGELARATVTAARGVMRTSAAAVTSGLPRSLLAVRRTALNLYFYLARDEQRVVFFFFKKQLPTLRPLEARLRIALQATPDDTKNLGSSDGTAAAAAGSSCSYRLVVPAFLIVRPTAEDLSLYAPAGTTAESGILLRIGAEQRNILAINNPEAERQAAAIYTTQTRQPLDSWPAAPFLELVETLRTWLADGMQATDEVDLALPGDPAAMSDVHATLYWFGAAYRSLAAELTRAESAPLEPALQLIVPHYHITEYVADIALGIDHKGRLATPAEPSPLSLKLRLEFGHELGGQVTRITLCPPDFLISGALHEAFVAQLLRAPPRELMAKLGQHDTTDWSTFLSSAKARLVIFRIDRNNRTDTDAVVLPGIWKDQPRTLILRVTANVDMNAQPVSVQVSEVTLSYDSQASQPQLLDAQTVTYFMRLAAALKSWLAVAR